MKTTSFIDSDGRLLVKSDPSDESNYYPSDRYAYKTHVKDPIYIPVNRIRTPYQTEDALNEDKVKENIEKIKSGKVLSAIIIGYNYDLHDGHHRLEAAIRSGHTHVPCVVGGRNERRIKAAEKRYRKVWKSESDKSFVEKGRILVKKLSGDLSSKVIYGIAHWVTVKEGPLEGRHLLIDGPRPADGKQSRGKILAGHGIPPHVIQKITGATHAHHLEHKHINHDSNGNPIKQEDAQFNNKQKNIAAEKKNRPEFDKIESVKPLSGNNEIVRTTNQSKKLHEILHEVESKIRDNRTESGHIVDSNGNIIWSNPGGVDYVDVSDAVKNGHMKGNVLTHNHPGGNSFSPEDINVLLKFGLSEIRAVSKKHIHSMNPPKGFDGSDKSIQKIFDEYNRISKEVRNEFQSKVNNGIMTPTEASERHFHEIWSRVAKRTGLQYERRDSGDLTKRHGVQAEVFRKSGRLHYRQRSQESGLRKTDEQYFREVVKVTDSSDQQQVTAIFMSKNGQILIKNSAQKTVYHGSWKKIDKFKNREIKDYNTIGSWFTSDPKTATDLYGPNLHKVQLELRKPYKAETDDFDLFFFNENIAKKYLNGKELNNPDRDVMTKLLRNKKYMTEFRQDLIDRGYDGIVFPNSMIDKDPDGSEGKHTVYIAFYPARQVKRHEIVESKTQKSVTITLGHLLIKKVR